MYFWSETREWGMAERYNYELYEIFNEPNIVNYFKVKRLAWAGHLVRMNYDRTLIQHQTRWSKKCWKTEIGIGKVVLIKI